MLVGLFQMWGPCSENVLKECPWRRKCRELQVIRNQESWSNVLLGLEVRR